MTASVPPEVAAELLTRALALLPPSGFWRSLVSFHLGMGAFMRNQLRAAERMFEVVRRAPRDERPPLTAVLAQTFSGWAHLLRGETGANVRWHQYLDILLQRTILRRGIATANATDVASVSRWVGSRGLRDVERAWQERTLPTFFTDIEFLTAARLFVAEERDGEALRLLELIEEHAAANENAATQVEARVIRACAHVRGGRSAAAVTAMQSALALAAKPRFLRPFTAEGAPILGLLERAAQSMADRSFATAVTATIAGAPKRSSAAPAPDALSDREIEVLHLIAAGASNCAAAQKLFVAPSTVKKHLENIYAKLGVNGRVQAIARARELRLL